MNCFLASTATVPPDTLRPRKDTMKTVDVEVNGV